MKKILFLLLILCAFYNINAQEKGLKSKIMGMWGVKSIIGESLLFFRPNEVIIYEATDLVIDHWTYTEIKEQGDTLLLKLLRNDGLYTRLKMTFLEDTILLVSTDGQGFSYLKKRKHKLNGYSKLLEFNKFLPEGTFRKPFRNYQFRTYASLTSAPEFLQAFWVSQNKAQNSTLELTIYNEFTDVGNRLWQINELFLYKHPENAQDYYFFILENYENNELAAIILSHHGDHLLYQFIQSRDPRSMNISAESRKWKILHKTANISITLKDICTNLDGKYFQELLGDYIQIAGESHIHLWDELWEIVDIKEKGVLNELEKGRYSIHPVYLKREKEGEIHMQKLFIHHNAERTIVSINHGDIIMGEGKIVPFIEQYYRKKHFLPQMLSILAIVIGILLVLAFIFYRSVLLPRRLKHNLTRTRLQGVKAQLNPHFLFNSMASIQSLMNQQRIADANRYLAELSDLLRYHLDGGADELVLLSEEIDAVKHYCTLEALRTPFELDIYVQEDIESESLEIPGQLLQPLVENAIKHGLRHTIAPHLVIRIEQDEMNLAIFIEDNGPGIRQRELASSNNRRKTHQGIALIKEKIGLLKKQGLHIQLSIMDLKEDLHLEETGTQVRLVLPRLYS